MPGAGTKTKIRRTAWLTAALWTALIATLGAWHHHRFQDQYYELGRVYARAAHAKDLIYRKWNAFHGGVYVPVTKSLQPNPYLDVPHRDVVTSAGQKLTLVNPAYMTRQVHELAETTDGIKAHITSLKPINPTNAPDTWERNALERFELGETEVSSLEEMDGHQVVRLMRPLVTEESCLKCHRKQGYAEGDIRGGISVAVPVEPIAAARESEAAAAFLGYGTVWGLGILGLAMAWKALSRSIELLERTNLQLNDQKRIAEEAARVRSMFLANMSHEIRTPLTAILGYADILQDEYSCGRKCSECSFCEVHQRDRRSIETIRRNGSHLLDIVNEILDLAKIESGELRLCPESCRPADVIAEVASLMQVRAAAKRLELAVEGSDASPGRVVIDVTRLRQILLNLVGNAIKFTETGRVTIVQRTASWNDRDCLVVDVEDTGPGIPEDKAKVIFEPFIQGEMSASRQHGGTGLGLAISNRLAEALGGRLTLQSEPGKGSCFTLALPIQFPTDPQSGAPHPEPDRVRGNSDPLTSASSAFLQFDGRVLLVEDCKDNQRLIAHILRRAGIDVGLAENGRIACELVLNTAGQRPFDLILMDMQMPVMDGYEATRALRESGYRGAIVALTAHAMNEEFVRCIQAGCDECAAKPIERAAFLAMLARHLTVREQSAIDAAQDAF